MCVLTQKTFMYNYKTNSCTIKKTLDWAIILGATFI